MLILVIFLLITALSAIVPYIGKNTSAPTTGDTLSGDVTIQTGIELSWTSATWTTDIKTVNVGTVSPIISNTWTK